ncbi:sensor histidine kinase [Massilia phyllosphaerae]|uniref:sensor histidine kinase n=1 Tax=Massilia phyllosphaerae TaxID=3106034 RepID=UPI002B1CB7A7|nr:histidine kinase [Massilia sp. SGZ-792]
MPTSRPNQQALSTALSSLYRAFDAVATWVTQLSWWKFLLFAALLLTAGTIVQQELFSGGEEDIVRTERSARRDEPTITIDDSGIHLNPRGRARSGATVNIDPEAEGAKAEAAAAAAAAEAEKAAGKAGKAAADAAAAGAQAEAAGKAAQAVPVPPVPPAPPGTPSRVAKSGRGDDEVHIDLPPQISDELSDAIEAAVDDAAEAKARSYHKQASTWFTSFVWLLVLALFGTKALVGGKKRAEAEMQTATAAAERESMQRQLSEAKMQTMQAQVEPHFLFNTLASVEHLIETDPPRASAMQRTLIQYLRAVLPQMRDNTLVTNLGREVDMVNAYLDLLKMRMEERLTVNVQVPSGLRSAAFPPMMLQSMVENAIKHGLECKPEGGHLDVTAEVFDSRLRVTVADDGVGFGVVPSKGTGLGLSNIRDRLALLHGKAGHLHIAANSPSGVIATIEVPYQLAPK